MLALSIRPQHAWAIVQGRKTIEYRTWRPVEVLQEGEKFAIHASGRKPTKSDLDDAEDSYGTRPPEDLTRSAIIAVARLQKITGGPGDYEWHLDQVRRLRKPIPSEGRLSLWPVPARLAKSLGR